MESHFPGAGIRHTGWLAGDLDGAGVRLLSVSIHDAVTEVGLAAYPDLEAIITRSDGHDHIDLDACQARDIRVYHLEGYATDSVAQLALMMLIGLARRVPEAMQQMHDSWDRSGLVGHDLRERTVGILGCGRIGGTLAGMLDALGVNTVTCDPDPAAHPTGLRHSRAMDLDGMLATCDALSIHVPLRPATRHLVDAAALDALGPEALVVNTARGDVIDHEALLQALDDGTVAGFAADVLPGEPHPPHLRRLGRRRDVILTPHLGAHNHATIRARYQRTAEIARAVLEGRPQDVARYCVNADA